MKRSISLSMLALSAMVVAQPAQSASLDSLLRDYVAPRAGIEHQWGYGSIGIPENQTVPNSIFVANNFETRLNQIRDQINTARAQGKLSFSESSRLMSELQRLSFEADRIHDGGVTYSEVTALMQRVESFSRNVDTTIANGNVGGGVGGGVIVSDVDQRLRDLNRRIEREARRGLLTSEQRRTLRNSMNWIARTEDELQSDRDFGEIADASGLTMEERRMLNSALDRVQSRLDRFVAQNRRGSMYY